MFDIGKVVDSANDMARLIIVTQYAGSKTVNVYASTGVSANQHSPGVGSPTRRWQDSNCWCQHNRPMPPTTDSSPWSLRACTILASTETSAYGQRHDGIGRRKGEACADFLRTLAPGLDLVSPVTDDDVSGHAVFVGDGTTAAGVTTVNYAAANITFANQPRWRC